ADRPPTGRARRRRDRSALGPVLPASRCTVGAPGGSGGQTTRTRRRTPTPHAIPARAASVRAVRAGARRVPSPRSWREDRAAAAGVWKAPDATAAAALPTAGAEPELARAADETEPEHATATRGAMDGVIGRGTKVFEAAPVQGEWRRLEDPDDVLELMDESAAGIVACVTD